MICVCSRGIECPAHPFLPKDPSPVRMWVCGSRTSVKDDGYGCGHEYPRPPRPKHRRGRRVNPIRTTTCPECGHVDALHNPPMKVHNSQEEGQTPWRVVGQTKDEITLSGPGPCQSVKTVPRAEFEEFWQEIK